MFHTGMMRNIIHHVLNIQLLPSIHTTLQRYLSSIMSAEQESFIYPNTNGVIRLHPLLKLSKSDSVLREGEGGINVFEETD